MIVIENAPRFAVYYRINRRVKWQYAQFAGCYDTIIEALAHIKIRLPAGTLFEYLVQDTETGEEIIGNSI